MATPGILNELPLLSVSPLGAMLDGGKLGEIPLPSGEVPPGTEPGQILKVFVYHDATDRLMATTRVPKAQVGEVAFLKIVAVKGAGAFLDWGLPKDLLLPWAEVRRDQKHMIVEGKKILVMLIQDPDGREAASARLNDFLTDEADGFWPGEKVSILVADPTDLGMRVIVNHRHWGLVHQNEIFGSLRRGDVREGYIKALRPDHKLNISLTAPGYAKADAVGQSILDALTRRGGFLAVTDKSEPKLIYDLFGVSKKAFKQALGTLYKNKEVSIEPTGIRLVRKG
ncbi:MAG: GntR family transcriptional regulator [Holophagaceae bacterium]|nr:GntR family transcriptional regulator [Holophagaceae bacterium]